MTKIMPKSLGDMYEIMVCTRQISENLESGRYSIRDASRMSGQIISRLFEALDELTSKDLALEHLLMAMEGYGETLEKFSDDVRDGLIILAAQHDVPEWIEQYIGYTQKLAERVREGTEKLDPLRDHLAQAGRIEIKRESPYQF